MADNFDPPWRLDPLQNITDFDGPTKRHGAGGEGGDTGDYFLFTPIDDDDQAWAIVGTISSSVEVLEVIFPNAQPLSPGVAISINGKHYAAQYSWVLGLYVGNETP